MNVHDCQGALITCAAVTVIAVAIAASDGPLPVMTCWLHLHT
jgi:hypothetical protein